MAEEKDMVQIDDSQRKSGPTGMARKGRKSITYLQRMKEEGKCIILSTHLFDLVEKICDRAAMIVEGKIVVDDTLPNLMNGRSLEDSFYDIYQKYQKQ